MNKRRVLLIPLLLWMILIFCFSAQKAEESGQISGTLSYQLVKTANHFFALGYDTDKMEQMAENIDYPVRKMAHATEYAILAVLMYLNVCQYMPRTAKRYVLAWAGAALYAATDEFHQLFVEGRSGMISDVGIDSIGAAVGILMICLMTFLWNNIKIIKRKR